MSWYLHPTNDIDSAIPAIAAAIASRTLAQPAIIVVPNKVVRTYVKQALAQHQGHVMAVTFMEEYAARRYFTGNSEGQVDLPTCHDVLLEGMVAKVLQNLPEGSPHWSAVRAWLDANPNSLMELAGQLTRLIRFYDKQRPSMLREFIDGTCPITTHSDAQWQADLVKALWAETTMAVPLAATKPLVITPESLAKSGPIVIVGGSFLPLLDYRWLFAIASTPGQHVLQVLVTPSQEYFADSPTKRERLRANLDDTPAGSHILSALGILSRNEQGFLIGMESDLQGQEIDANWGDGSWREPSRHTRLGRLQNSLLVNDACKIKLNRQDDTLKITSCWSHVRELEVLREDILKLLEADTTLHPRDFLVCAPNLEDYLPHIDRVFLRAPKLPWSLTGDGIGLASPVYALLHRILDAVGGRIRRSDILGIVQNPCWLAKHGLESDDMDMLKTLLAEGGARYAFDDLQRARDLKDWPDATTDRTGTWDEWFDAVALGMVVSDEDECKRGGAVEGDTVLPVAGLGTVEARHIGRILGPLHTLIQTIKSIADLALSIPEWTAQIIRIVDAQIGERRGQTEDSDHVESIRNSIRRIHGQADRAAITKDYLLKYNDFQTFLKRAISDEGSPKGRALFEAITIVPLAQARIIPSKVIAILGMGQETFPARKQPLGFDLTECSRMDYKLDAILDASPSQIDRLTLLEVVISARTNLWIYYTGRDATNATKRDMAVPIRDIVEAFEAPSDDSPSLQQESVAFPWFQPVIDTRYSCVVEGPRVNKDPKSIPNAIRVSTSLDKAGVSMSETSIVISAKTIEDFFINPARHHLSAGRELCFLDVDSIDEDDGFPADIRDEVTLQVWNHALKHEISLEHSLPVVWKEICRTGQVTRSNQTFLLERIQAHLGLFTNHYNDSRHLVGRRVLPERSENPFPGAIGHVRDTWEKGFIFASKTGDPKAKAQRCLWRALARWLFHSQSNLHEEFHIYSISMAEPTKRMHLKVTVNEINRIAWREKLHGLVIGNQNVLIPAYVDELKTGTWSFEDGNTKIPEMADIPDQLTRRSENWDRDTRRYLDQEVLPESDHWTAFTELVVAVNCVTEELEH